jgi:dipeptidase E
MPIDLHLLSTPGDGDIRYIIEACRPYLQVQTQPVVAFMPWASVNSDWFPYTQKAFSGLAEVAALNPVPASLAESQRILGRCGAVYISGGNTYLLNHRLHESGLFEPLRQRALDGLPIVGFSAGAILCGPNILTTHDINLVPTAHFDSLNLLPYNVVAHYPATDPQRNEEDEWLTDYHAMHTNTILALEDDAWVRWNGQALARVRGAVWTLETDKPRSPWSAG